MFGKKIKQILLMLFLVSCTVSLFACTSGNIGPEISPLAENDVRAFADPAAENIFQAMNSGNYTAYQRDFDERLKNNMSEDTFKTVNDKRIEVVGTYQSKTYWQITQKNDKLTVFYRAKFTREPAGVLLTIVFKDISGNWQIDGLAYDSPLMREND
jgi:hypothetical protein